MIVIERDFDKTDNILLFTREHARTLIFADTNKLLLWLAQHVGSYKSKRSRHRKGYGYIHTWLNEASAVFDEIGGEYNNKFGFKFTRDPSSLYCYTGKGWKYFIIFYDDGHGSSVNEYKSYLKFDNDTQAVHYQLSQYQ
jgi:hypothetical protein